jgi:hypothetical protein
MEAQWKAGDLAQIEPGRFVEVMYEPRDGKALVRDIDTSYRKMSVSDLWLFASAGDKNAVAEIRFRSDPSLPAAPLPGYIVSFVDVKVLRSATVDDLAPQYHCIMPGDPEFVSPWGSSDED